MDNTKIKNMTLGQTLWDDQVKGLHCESKPNGTGFFLYYRTKEGKQRRPKLGQFGILTLHQAREIARGWLAKIAVGQDPQDERAKRKEAAVAASQEFTVGQGYQLALNHHWSEKRYQDSGWAERAARLYEKRIEPEFERLALKEVTIGQVRAWHARMKETPIDANRALSVFGKIFKVAQEREKLPMGHNPCSFVKSFPERKRSRYASPEELAAIFRELEKHRGENPKGVAFLTLLMFTGSRPSGIERARWRDLTEFEKDGETYGRLTFAGKSSASSGEEEAVLLPPMALKALEDLPRHPNATITGIKLPEKLWNKIRIAAKCPDLWARDLRRTYATVGYSGGVDRKVVSELLNHHSEQTTKIYAKLDHRARLQAVDLISEKLDSIKHAALNPKNNTSKNLGLKGQPSEAHTTERCN